MFLYSENSHLNLSTKISRIFTGSALMGDKFSVELFFEGKLLEKKIVNTEEEANSIAENFLGKPQTSFLRD